jgi:hypothetical protein
VAGDGRGRVGGGIFVVDDAGGFWDSRGVVGAAWVGMVGHRDFGGVGGAVAVCFAGGAGEREIPGSRVSGTEAIGTHAVFLACFAKGTRVVCIGQPDGGNLRGDFVSGIFAAVFAHFAVEAGIAGSGADRSGGIWDASFVSGDERVRVDEYRWAGIHRSFTSDRQLVGGDGVSRSNGYVAVVVLETAEGGSVVPF